MNPMRIASVVPVFCHPGWRGSGVARSATDLLLSLAHRGHEVDVVSPLVDGGQRFDAPAERTFEQGRLRLHFSAGSSSTWLGTSCGEIDRLLNPLLPGADLVYIHSFMSPFTDRAVSLASQYRKPIVVHPQGKFSLGAMGRRRQLKRLYLAVRGIRLLRRASLVIPCTDSPAELADGLFEGIPTAACPNGLDPDEYQNPHLPAPLDGPYVLYLGWLDPRKNLDLLIKAFAAAKIGQPWKLAVVGPDHYGLLPELRQLAEERGVADRVVFPGAVDGLEKLAWLYNAAMFAMPTSGEGLSLAMVEAIACSLPCLLSPGANYPEIEPAGAGRVLPLDEAAWTRAIEGWANDEPARQAAARCARPLFETRHDLAAVGARLEGLLQSVLPERVSAASA